MARRSWLAAVLEFYLPRDEGQAVVQAANEAFRPLLRLLAAHRGASVTVALDPGTARMLLRHGQAGILQELAAGVERGQVELAGGASGHALLPRLPRREVERQLRLGHERMGELLGRSWRPQGLLPPALALSRQVAEAAADRGLRWVLADELALGRLGIAPTERVAALRGRPDVLLFFRDRAASRALATGARLERSWRGYRVAVAPAAAFTAGGGVLEQFGRLLAGEGPTLATLSDLATHFASREQVEPLPCSCRTSEEELASGVPFASWSAPDNELQALLWRLLYLALREADRLAGAAGESDPACGRLRALLDEGIHSAPFRFASGRPWWQPEEVRAAAGHLAAALESCAGVVPQEIRDEARMLESRLHEGIAIWERHGSPDRLAAGGGGAPPPELAG